MYLFLFNFSVKGVERFRVVDFLVMFILVLFDFIVLFIMLVEKVVDIIKSG